MTPANPRNSPPQAGCAPRSDEIAANESNRTGAPYDERSSRAQPVAQQREAFSGDPRLQHYTPRAAAEVAREALRLDAAIGEVWD